MIFLLEFVFVSICNLLSSGVCYINCMCIKQWERAYLCTSWCFCPQNRTKVFCLWESKCSKFLGIPNVRTLFFLVLSENQWKERFFYISSYFSVFLGTFEYVSVLLGTCVLLKSRSLPVPPCYQTRNRTRNIKHI
jgi:hypothetical protein